MSLTDEEKVFNKSGLCGQGESNSRIVLGKDVLYHLTMAAMHPAGFEPTITDPKSVVISISLRVQKQHIMLFLFWIRYFSFLSRNHTHLLEKKQKRVTMQLCQRLLNPIFLRK